jgi:hypothetical protein
MLMINKLVTLAAIIFLSNVSLFSQGYDNLFNTIHMRNRKIERVGDRKYWITDLMTGKRPLWNLGNSKYPARKKKYNLADSTVINPFYLDTLHNRFNYSLWDEYNFLAWQGYEDRMLFNDYNRNNKTEIITFKTNPVHPTEIFEIDSIKSAQLLFTYPSVARFPVAQYDVDGDSSIDLVLNTDGSRGIFVYSSSDTNLLPTTKKFFFSFSPDVQVDNIFFDDLDNNGKSDLLFSVNRDWGGVQIYEYNKDSNNFVWVFGQNMLQSWQGYAIGDFDRDGKKDIVLSTSEEGIVHVIECVGEHQYMDVFHDTTYLVNAFHQIKTNDLDGNGKPEFWIGGNDVSIPFSYTLLCFESDSNNSYSPKRKITFLNHFGFLFRKIMPIDIDNDGIEELFVGLDNFLYLLSYSKAEAKFNIVYYKKMKFNSDDDYVTDVNFYDLFNTDKKDMLVSWIDSYGTEPLQYYDKTGIYRIEKSTAVINNGNNVLSKFDLQQNYPNPFNPTTTIQFSLPSETEIFLGISDILGRKIKTLVNAKYQAGRYEVRWDGKDDNSIMASSGVYFITLQANKYTKTIKTTLTK